MIGNISSRILNLFINYGVISEEFEIYQYGLEVIISNTLGILGVLLLAIMSGLVIEGVIFIIVFARLRSYTGGFHCKTYLTCNLGYMSVFMVYVLFSQYINTIVFNAGTILSFIFVIIYAPVDHFNKPLNDNEKQMFKKKSIVCFIIFAICSLIFIKFLPTIQYALISTAFLMILGKGLRNNEINEKSS